MARLQEYYNGTIAGELKDKLGLASVMQVPRIEKITLNMGVGEAVADKKIIDRINSHEGIISLGAQDNVPLYLSIMDVFLLPSWWEGFGNVLVQAAAMGVPVISTKATGTMDAVNDGFNGLLVEPKSIKQLAEKMDLLFNDNETRIRMGRNGPLWAENFDNIIIWNAMEKIYNGGA